MSREEILENEFEDCFDKSTHATGGGYEADYTDKWRFYRSFKPHILEYAKQESIAFAEFLHPDSDGNNWVMYDAHDSWINLKDDEVKSTEELYNLYLKSKEQ